jgi:hypothetical protein
LRRRPRREPFRSRVHEVCPKDWKEASVGRIRYKER